MNDDTREELRALESLGTPYRFKTGLSADEEAVIFGTHGIIEWYSFDNQTWNQASHHKETFGATLGQTASAWGPRTTCCISA